MTSVIGHEGYPEILARELKTYWVKKKTDSGYIEGLSALDAPSAAKKYAVEYFRGFNYPPEKVEINVVDPDKHIRNFIVKARTQTVYDVEEVDHFDN